MCPTNKAFFLINWSSFVIDNETTLLTNIICDSWDLGKYNIVDVIYCKFLHQIVVVLEHLHLSFTKALPFLMECPVHLFHTLLSCDRICLSPCSYYLFTILPNTFLDRFFLIQAEEKRDETCHLTSECKKKILSIKCFQ